MFAEDEDGQQYIAVGNEEEDCDEDKGEDKGSVNDKA